MATMGYSDENIQNLIPKHNLRVKTVKPPRYISKFRTTVVQENKSGKDAKKTMGPAKVEMPFPNKYLKKNSRESKLPKKKTFTRLDTFNLKKPHVPSHTSNPLMGLHTKKDFVKTNAMEKINAEPRKPQVTYTDTNRGHSHLQENSGLVPKCIMKKDYGETPEYVQQGKEEVQRAQEEYHDYVEERIKQGAMKELSEEERGVILKGLKRNWKKLNHQYQGLSLVTDTISKKQRKEHLEQAMQRLEDDISQQGLVPKCIMKKDYGETPEYVQQGKEEVQRAQEEYHDYVEERIKQGAMKELSEEERGVILKGLKTNWKKLNHQYQRLPLVADTISKKQRKEHLEQAMQQLEDDISQPGLVPKCIMKKDYGETPEYVQQGKEEVQRGQEEYDDYVEERIKQGAMKELSEEERGVILKRNWKKLNHQYQGLPLVMDTISKKQRKEHLEQAMQQLEDDISQQGLVPKCIMKKDYGETPKYVQQGKEEVQRAQEEYHDYVEERIKQGAMKELSEEERGVNLKGLKRNWKKLNDQYQGLPLVTDTISKKQRKEHLEQAMQQLEDDISQLERYIAIN